MQDAGNTLAVDFTGEKITRPKFTGTGLTGTIFRRNPEGGAGLREEPGRPAATASMQMSGTTHAEKERMLSERQVELRRSLPRQPSIAFAKPGEGRQISLSRPSPSAIRPADTTLITSRDFQRALNFPEKVAGKAYNAGGE